MKPSISQIITIVYLIMFPFGCTNKSRSGSTESRIDTLPRTVHTQYLLANLSVVAAEGFLFGQQDATLYGIGWEGDSGRSDIQSVVGDYPAVIGFDLGRIERDSETNIDNVSFEKIRQEIIQQYKRGGIVTISWHADNPLTGGDSWDIENIEGAVTSILPGGENYSLFVDWLQLVADFFHSLKNDDNTPIPVLFRPWHEHTGSWFWWGKDHCTEDEYKQLWQMTRDFLDQQGVNHLLYVYSPDAQGPGNIYMERYPGDEYVDLLGLDCYHRDNEKGIETYQRTLRTILSFMTVEGAKRNKPIALTETGLETIPVPDWWTNVLFPVLDEFPVSYVLVWRNARERSDHYYGPYPGHLSESDFVTFYQHPKTLFSSDIPDMYNP